MNCILFFWPSRTSSAHQSACAISFCLSMRWRVRLICEGGKMRTQLTKATRKIHVNKHDHCCKGKANRCVYKMTLIFHLYQLPLPSSPEWEVANSVAQKPARHGKHYLEELHFISKRLQAYSSWSCPSISKAYTWNRRPNSGAETYLISGAIYQTTEKAVA